jgi:hypothetical protein
VSIKGCYPIQQATALLVGQARRPQCGRVKKLDQSSLAVGHLGSAADGCWRRPFRGVESVGKCGSRTLTKLRDAWLWINHVLSGILSSVMNTDELSGCRKLLRHWARKWDAPELADEITYEWSTRLCRAYPERNLIRLSSLLKDLGYVTLFDEVLCHEAAHVAVFHICRSQAAIHGPEWDVPRWT